jgi:UDP-4-amino-4,6-dideoxy-N-acetyl-beta-L-altrosamine transaminase
MIPYGKQSIGEDERKAVLEVLKSDFLTSGPAVEAFEEKVAAFCNARHAIAVSNGTAALHVAVAALDLKTADEGITSPNTFVASANCMAYCRVFPGFSDIDITTYCMDVNELKKRIGSRTRLIIPVHFAGQPCDMESIWNLAREKKLYVIEDAAHALGSSWTDQGGIRRIIGSCSHSHMVTFSFHPVKTITTGEGGMILTNDDELAMKCRVIRNHGIVRDPLKFTGIELNACDETETEASPWYYEMQSLGFNYRLSDVQSALGLIQMQRLEHFVEIRRKLWKRYNDALGGIKEFTIPLERENVHSAWHLYAARTSCRDRLLKHLRSKGIGAHAMYIPVHLQPWYKNQYGYQTGDFPVSEKYFNTCLVLPLYPMLKMEEQTFIIKTIQDFFAENVARK